MAGRAHFAPAHDLPSIVHRLDIVTGGRWQVVGATCRLHKSFPIPQERVPGVACVAADANSRHLAAFVDQVALADAIGRQSAEVDHLPVPQEGVRVAVRVKAETGHLAALIDVTGKAATPAQRAEVTHPTVLPYDSVRKARPRDLAARIDTGGAASAKVDDLAAIPQLRVRSCRRPRSPHDQSVLAQEHGLLGRCHIEPSQVGAEVLERTARPEHGTRRARGVGDAAANDAILRQQQRRQDRQTCE